MRRIQGILLVWPVTEDGAALYEELYQKGINLVFLNEPHCDTECYRQAAASRRLGNWEGAGLALSRRIT